MASRQSQGLKLFERISHVDQASFRGVGIQKSAGPGIIQSKNRTGMAIERDLQSIECHSSDSGRWCRCRVTGKRHTRHPRTRDRHRNQGLHVVCTPQ